MVDNFTVRTPHGYVQFRPSLHIQATGADESNSYGSGPCLLFDSRVETQQAGIRLIPKAANEAKAVAGSTESFAFFQIGPLGTLRCLVDQQNGCRGQHSDHDENGTSQVTCSRI